MPKTTSKKTQKRDWLNQDGVALVSTDTELSFRRDKSDPWFNGFLVIGDCSRHVTLEFDAYTKEDVDKRLKKLNLLESHLQHLRNELRAAREHLQTEKEAEASRKKRAAERKAKGETVQTIPFIDL